MRNGFYYFKLEKNYVLWKCILCIYSGKLDKMFEKDLFIFRGGNVKILRKVLLEYLLYFRYYDKDDRYCRKGRKGRDYRIYRLE